MRGLVKRAASPPLMCVSICHLQQSGDAICSYPSMTENVLNEFKKGTYTTSLEMIQETIALGRRQDALSAGRSFLQMTGASRRLRVDAHRRQRDAG